VRLSPYRRHRAALGAAFEVEFPPNVEQWRLRLAAQGSDLPINFLLGWLKHESGGNPCAVGIPGVEAGMFQTYHPTDDRYGATYPELRAGCSGSSIVNPAAINRDLQVKSGLNYVRSKRDAARRHLAAVGASWSESSSDFWSMVKQEHALPCVAVDLLPLVTTKLGRAPSSWSEFRSTAMTIPASSMPAGCARFANSPSHRSLRSRLEDTLANAEKVGAYGAGGGRGASGGSLLAALAIAGILTLGSMAYFQRRS
jgi:hypothetical protein